MPIEPSDIEDAATGPKRITGDEGTVEERSINELIDADRYANAKQATTVPFGMRLAKMRFPNTTD